MAKQIINIGTTANDGTGDPIRIAFDKVNDNFTELYNDDANDDLDGVTTRGNTTTNSIQVGAATITGDLTVDTDTLYVDSANNRVGIGTTSPVSLLDLGSGSTSGDGLSFGTTQTEIRRGNSGADLQISHWGDVSVIIDSDNNDSATRGFKIMEGSTDAGTANELFRVTSGGKVGIGTSSPASILDIQSNSSLAIKLGNSLGVNGYQLKSNVSSSDDFGFVIEDYSGTDLYQIQAGSGGFHRFLIDGSEKMRITSSGNVGINVNDPDSQLEIVNSSGGSYRLGYAGGTDSYFDSENFYIRSGSGGSNKFVVNASGNVGIGTTSPGAKLDISFSGGGDSIKSASTSSTSFNSSKFYNDNSKGWHNLVYGSAYSGGSIFNIGADGAIIYGNTTSGITTLGAFDLLFGTNSTERMRIDSSGRVGIGTTSVDSKFHIESALTASASSQQLKIENTTTGQPSVLGMFAVADNGGLGNAGAIYFDAGADGSSANNILAFNADHQTDNNYDLVLTGNGNVGIGTTSPATTLEIAKNDIVNGVTLRLNNTHNGADWGAGSKVGVIDFYSTDTSAPSNVLGAIELQQSSASSTYASVTDFVFKNFGSGTLSETMRIDGSGNVGIGTSSPVYDFEINKDNGAGSATYLSLRSNDTGIAILLFGNQSDQATAGISYYSSTQHLQFNGYNNTERMRITSGGNVLVGKTTDDDNTNGVRLAGVGILAASRPNNAALILNRTGTDGSIALFRNDGSDAGNISVSGTTTSYNTSSDYRLKEDTKNFDGLAMLNDINVYDFKWKESEKRSYGVFAHELQEVLPQAVNGEKDAEEMQSVDYSKIVPVLVKAIQQQQEEINNLKQQINK